MKKISVIFFLLCLISILIFNKFKKENINILYIGDNRVFYNYIKNIEYYDVNRYTYDNILYSKIEDEIKSNSYKIIKDKEVFLNQLISKSDIVILSANNFEYKNKCRKSNRILNDYDNNISDDINNLVRTINKISRAKVIILGNTCGNKKYNQKLNLNNSTYVNYENIDNLGEIIGKIVNN